MAETSTFPLKDVYELPKVETQSSQEIYHPRRRKGSVARCWDPRGWSTSIKILAGVTTIAAVLAGTIVGAVLGAKNTQYPDYGYLDYALRDVYYGRSFLDMFWFFTDVDPTFGFVQYVDRSTAESLGLTHATESSVVLRVDNKTQYAPRGRKSVRLESKKTYDNGLFIFDIIHTPNGCGTWPALWLADTYNWPLNGEIDILEATNKATEGTTVTLHTDKGCSVKGRRKQLGSTQHSTCDDHHGTAGCSVQARPATYGPEFNENGGGVYAVELRDAGTRVWVFPRHSMPDDILNPDRSPDPSSWGTALADFPSTHCDISSHFRNQSIVINIDLCGEMGAQPEVYSELYNCPATCEEYVARNAKNFSQAYWELGMFRVYQSR